MTNGAALPTVLMLPTRKAAISAMVLIAEHMCTHSLFRPVFLVSNESMDTLIRRSLVGESQVEVRQLYGESRRSAQREDDSGQANQHVVVQPVVLAERIGRKVRGRLFRLWTQRLARASIVEAWMLVRRWRRMFSRAQLILAEYRPVAVMLSGDRLHNEELVFIRAAREALCARIVVPFAYSSAENIATKRTGNPLYCWPGGRYPLLKWWIRWRYPGQLYRNRSGETVLFYAPWHTLVLAANRMLPANPWTVGGGDSSVVAVASASEFDEYVQMGVPPSKLAITGEPAHDVLYEASRNSSVVRRRVAHRYRLGEAPMIIYAVPQLAEHYTRDLARYWRELDHTVSELQQTGVNILLSLNPKSKAGDYEFLAKKYDVCLLREPLMECLPAADLLVASASSVVRWAAIIGVPTLIVDFFCLYYGIEFDSFDHLPGVTKVRRRDMLGTHLDQLLHDNTFRKHVFERSAGCVDSLAPLDGRARHRIVNLVSKQTEALRSKV